MSIDAITSAQIARVRSIVKQVVEDADLSTSVTFKSESSKSYNPVTGVVSHTTSSTSVSAFCNPISVKEVEASNDRYKVGDIVCWIAIDVISEPNENDVVTISSKDYAIIDWRRDSAAAAYRMVLRKV